MPTTRIITVASTKGGVGKTTLAYELAALWRAVLIDLDWDAGGVTGLWGANADRYGTRLLDALGDGRGPRPIEAPGRPRLVASHPDLAVSQPEPGDLADRLARWGDEWSAQYIVVDTHPGAVPATFGALSAAHAVVVPIVLRERELAAAEGMLGEFRDYPLILAPTMVPPIPPGRQLDRLERLAREYRVPVAPPISEHRWLGRRLQRRAISLIPHPSAQTRRAAEQFAAVAGFVDAYLARSAVNV